VVAGSHVGVRLPPSAHRFCHAAFLNTYRISPIIDENDNFALKTGIELRALRRLQREQKPGRYVFMSERGAPMSAVASTPNCRDLFRRAAIYADKMMVTLRARTLGRSTARPARSRAR